MLQLFRVCLVFPPLVSIYGLFPVLVSCRLSLIQFQVCVICVNYNVYLSPVFCLPFRLVYSLFPVCLPCPVLPLMLSLKTIILKYLSVCVFLVSPCCVHHNRRPDQTVSVVPSPRFVLFVFSSVYLFLSFLSLMLAVRGTLCPLFTGVFAAVRGSPIPRFAGVLAAVRGSAIPPFAGVVAAVRGSAIPPFAGVHAAVHGSTSPQFPRDDSTIHG